MNIANDEIKRKLIEKAPPLAGDAGWTEDTLSRSAVLAGFDRAMSISVFPRGVPDALCYLSRWANERMMEKLADIDQGGLRVRERIELAVWERLEVLAPFKKAEAKAIAYWLRPFRKWQGARLVWETADIIWTWAGDTATDYNRYTKRALLSGVITTTTMFWLNDKSEGHIESRAFLNRRIDNVLTIGKIVGSRKKA